MPERAVQVRRIVLVGLMGAGKTTVGRQLAERLGWTFVDLDDAIAARTGQTVEQIFAQRGEHEFRRLEQQLTAELASADRLVLAPGGGWITRAEQPGAGTIVFWLRVSPDEAVRRVQQDGVVRPLLQQADPVATAHRLAQERNAKYSGMGIAVETQDRAPAQVVNEILGILGDRIADAPETHESNG